MDSSALVTGLNSTDPDHLAVIDAISSDRGPVILPVAILSKATFVIESSLGDRLLIAFLRSILQSEFLLDCGESDFERILHLVTRYADLPLGFADAAVIACAERNGGKVATLDLRHFGVVAREGTIQIVP